MKQCCIYFFLRLFLQVASQKILEKRKWTLQRKDCNGRLHVISNPWPNVVSSLRSDLSNPPPFLFLRVETPYGRGKFSRSACSPSHRFSPPFSRSVVCAAACVCVCMLCVCFVCMFYVYERTYAGTSVDYIGTCAPRDCRVGGKADIAGGVSKPFRRPCREFSTAWLLVAVGRFVRLPRACGWRYTSAKGYESRGVRVAVASSRKSPNHPDDSCFLLDSSTRSVQFLMPVLLDRTQFIL